MSTMLEDRPRPSRAAEKRRASRERTNLAARLEFGGGMFGAECLVTQLSSSGARLSLPLDIVLLDILDLIVPERGIRRRARVAWRKDDIVGLSFDVPPGEDSAVDGGDHLRRIQELETDNARLRAKVGELIMQVRRLTDE